MSELKTRLLGQTMNEYGCDTKIYLKAEADAVIAHQKYKRCLAMAKWCASRSASWCLDPADDELHKSDFYDKWKLRWLELAEKFK